MLVVLVVVLAHPMAAAARGGTTCSCDPLVLVQKELQPQPLGTEFQTVGKIVTLLVQLFSIRLRLLRRHAGHHTACRRVPRILTVSVAMTGSVRVRRNGRRSGARRGGRGGGRRSRSGVVVTVTVTVQHGVGGRG